jgi:hypothetical protein
LLKGKAEDGSRLGGETLLRSRQKCRKNTVKQPQAGNREL